jgi:hypothetical protein
VGCKVDSKISEILVSEVEEEVYSAEYFVTEKHRRKLDVSGERLKD